MGSFDVPISRAYHSKTDPLMNPILSAVLLPTTNVHSKAYTLPKGPWRVHPKQCGARKVCDLQFSSFSCAR